MLLGVGQLHQLHQSCLCSGLDLLILMLLGVGLAVVTTFTVFGGLMWAILSRTRGLLCSSCVLVRVWWTLSSLNRVVKVHPSNLKHQHLQSLPENEYSVKDVFGHLNIMLKTVQTDTKSYVCLMLP